VFVGEVVVAFVVCWNRHDSTCANVCENEVGYIHGYVLTVCRVGCFESRVHTAFFTPGFAVGVYAFDELRYFVVFLANVTRHGVFGCERDKRCAIEGVQTSRETVHIAVSFHAERNRRTFLSAYPVALHLFDAVRPTVEFFETVEEFTRIVGDVEIPLVECSFLNGRLTPPASTVFDLFVRKHRLAVGAPVHIALAVLDESFLCETFEHPLVPTVVAGFTRRDLAFPVVTETHRLHLFAHRLDALESPVTGVGVAFECCVFSRETERVPPHRV